MPFLDARALINDPQGMRKLRECITRRRTERMKRKIEGALANEPEAKASEKPPVSKLEDASAE